MYKTAEKQASKGFIKETMEIFKWTFIDFNGMNWLPISNRNCRLWLKRVWN